MTGSALAEYAVIAISSWLPILNPIAILPQFVAFTEGMPRHEAVATARRATIVAASLLVTTSLLGSLVFQAFGITMPAFRLAGGVILFIIALDMLRAQSLRYRTTKEEQQETKEKDDIAVFPVAIPLIAGPGTITTSLILGEHAATAWEHVVLIATLLLGMALMYLSLTYADRIFGYLGYIGRNVSVRLMGIILAAVAAQFILDALTQVFGRT